MIAKNKLIKYKKKKKKVIDHRKIWKKKFPLVKKCPFVNICHLANEQTMVKNQQLSKWMRIRDSVRQVKNILII